MAPSRFLLSIAFSLALCLTALPSPALARLDLARLRTHPKLLQAGGQLAGALPASAEVVHTELSGLPRRSLALDKTCDITNIKILSRDVASLSSSRTLFEFRFTNTCAYNITSALFSYCFNFAAWNPFGVSTPPGISSCTPSTPGFAQAKVKYEGTVWENIFCRLQVNQGPCNRTPVQLMPGQSLSFYYADVTAYDLCVYDVTYDTNPKDTRSVDPDIQAPKACSYDAPRPQCLPASLKSKYCGNGQYRLTSPSCSTVKWC